ncbi:MAG: TraR/DksA family transcriptional regulator [Deltaproteobacteria bacterium]|nr:MAG: TraR/DksA family transcriptional regulator [Deltaproteobacteria bacterium]
MIHGETGGTFMGSPFDKKFLESQKSKLLELKSQIMNSIAEHGNSDFHVDKDQTTEDGDQAQAYQDQNVAFGLRERDLQRLRDIDIALSKIDDGSYGFCEETDEPIGKTRLEKMPWARLSVEAAEELEKEQGRFRIAA